MNTKLADGALDADLKLFRRTELGYGFQMAGEDRVQSVARALQVIEALNARHVTSVATIHAETGIPKPTIVRLLSTLTNAGYVVRVSRRDGYALAEKILRLSAGFHYRDALVDIGRPLLEAFTAEHKWQISLATFDKDAMLVRFNTRHMSPFAPDQLFLNRRIGLLASAMGRAYLAFCAPAERKAIVQTLQSSTDPDNDLAKYPERFETLMAMIRQDGYATIERAPGNHTRSIAVPVLNKEGAALAAMAMFYYSPAMTELQAINRYLDKLYTIGDRVANDLPKTYGEDAK